MGPDTGLPQPSGTPDIDAPPLDLVAEPGRRAAEPRPARWRVRTDRVAFVLAVTLAALGTSAELGGFELGGAPVAGAPSASVTGDDGGPVPVSGPVGTAWAGQGHDGRVRFATEHTMGLGLVALEQLDYDWESRLANWRIDFVEGSGRVAGYTWSQEQRIEVFVRPNSSSADLARVLAHELGHAVDVTHNDGDERLAWLEQRGAPADTPWWPSSGAADFETGAGDFAECFAVWLVGSDDYRSVVGPVPTSDDLELLARLAG